MTRVVLCTCACLPLLLAMRRIEEGDGVVLWDGGLHIGRPVLAAGLIVFSLYRYEGLASAVLSFYLLYLLTCAYIDKKTMYVYSLINRMALTLALALHVLRALSYGLPEGRRLLEAMFYLGFLRLQARWGLYGEGDGDVFAISALYLAYFLDGREWLFAFVAQSFLSILIFLLTNAKYVDGRRLRMREKRAYVPSILLANIILCGYFTV